MLNQTSELAIRVLIHLCLESPARSVSPRRLATQLGASPSYLSKVTSQLVKAGILRSFRGSRGGVALGRKSTEITLLEIVEACQGVFVGDFCKGLQDQQTPVCGFHAAMVEVHEATLEILGRWTLQDLVLEPQREYPCTMACHPPLQDNPSASGKGRR